VQGDVGIRFDIFYVQGDVGLYMQNTFRHEKQQGDVGLN